MTNIAELQRVMRAFGANVLIVGDILESHRNEILHTVRFQRGGIDLFHPQHHSSFVLPDHAEVIVVLDEVCDLSHDDQHRLLEWCSRHDGQIVSFASRSPYTKVCDGSLIERLYYQLNTFCVVLGRE